MLRLQLSLLKLHFHLRFHFGLHNDHLHFGLRFLCFHLHLCLELLLFHLHFSLTYLHFLLCLCHFCLSFVGFRIRFLRRFHVLEVIFDLSTEPEPSHYSKKQRLRCFKRHTACLDHRCQAGHQLTHRVHKVTDLLLVFGSLNVNSRVGFNVDPVGTLHVVLEQFQHRFPLRGRQRFLNLRVDGRRGGRLSWHLRLRYSLLLLQLRNHLRLLFLGGSDKRQTCS